MRRPSPPRPWLRIRIIPRLNYNPAFDTAVENQDQLTAQYYLNLPIAGQSSSNTVWLYALWQKSSWRSAASGIYGAYHESKYNNIASRATKLNLSSNLHYRFPVQFENGNYTTGNEHKMLKILTIPERSPFFPAGSSYIIEISSNWTH